MIIPVRELKPGIGLVENGNMIKLLQILKEIEYPLAGKDDLKSYGGVEGWKGKLVYMSPEKFLKLAAPLPDGCINQKSLKNVEDRMKNQLPLDFCVLEVNMKTKTVTGHEGRHRCMAAKKLGIEKVPVLIYTGSSFDRVPQWDKTTHDEIDRAEFRPQLKENEDGGTFRMYHGGSRWSYLPDDIQPGKKNRYEAGVGIYFTNSYNTARKYARGGKVVHMVEIDKNYRDISRVMISVEEMVNFVKSVSGLKKRNDIIKDILAYSQRTNRTEISGDVLNNLIVNYEAGAGRPGVEIAKFLASKGVDASLQRQSGEEVWLVVFNPKILKKVTVVNPKDINSDSDFMLPSSTNESYEKDEAEEDAKMAAAEKYFSIGQDEEDVGDNYCWIWDGSFVKAKKGGTHGVNFTHDVADRNFKGWYDVNKHAVSVVFPEHIRRKIQGSPTVTDIPQNLYTALQRKFNKTLSDGDFHVFENKNQGERIKTFDQIQEEQDPGGVNHDLRLICVKCGNQQTCRCGKPKREFHGICQDCL